MASATAKKAAPAAKRTAPVKKAAVKKAPAKKAAPAKKTVPSKPAGTVRKSNPVKAVAKKAPTKKTLPPVRNAAAVKAAQHAQSPKTDAAKVVSATKVAAKKAAKKAAVAPKRVAVKRAPAATKGVGLTSSNPNITAQVPASQVILTLETLGEMSKKTKKDVAISLFEIPAALVNKMDAEELDAILHGNHVYWVSQQA